MATKTNISSKNRITISVLAWIAVTLKCCNESESVCTDERSSSVIKLNTIQEYRLFAIGFLKRESSLAYFLSFKRQQDYRMHTVTTNGVVLSSPVFP